MAYQSHADLGGRPGFGPVLPEPEGELWHAAFEPRALAVTLAMGATGAWTIDQSRAARETLPDYAQLDYYRIWLAALERLMAARGIVQADEIAAGQALHPPVPLPRRLAAADVAAVLARGAPTARPAPGPARFAVGSLVRSRGHGLPHHSRLPRYAQGKTGTVVAVHGAHVFADASGQGLGEQPQWLYTVAFSGRTLWGDEADATLSVSIDAWEPYLEAAEADSSAPAADGPSLPGRAA